MTGTLDLPPYSPAELVEEFRVDAGGASAANVYAVRGGTAGGVVNYDIDIRAVEHEVSSGATVVFTHAEKVSSWGRELCSLVAAAVGHRMGLDISLNFLLGRRSSGVPVHVDPSDSLVVQIAGSKAWRFQNAPDPARPRPTQFTLASAPPDESFEQVTLEPGQAIYVPVGTWHGTETLSESTFSASLFVAPVTARARLLSMLPDPVLRPSGPLFAPEDVNAEAVLEEARRRWSHDAVTERAR